MNILIRNQKGEDSKKLHVVIIFGLGLIGSSIRKQLMLHNFKVLFSLIMHWENRKSFVKDLWDIHNHLEYLSNESSNPNKKLSFVWAAGKSGFSSTQADIAGELVNYQEVISTITSQWSKKFPNNTSFYLLSSAGALFEGQRIVGHSSQPSPSRPYGYLKKSQEKLLQDKSLPFNQYIYRISSVYGYIDSAHRMGLIPMLLLNGIRYSVSHIFGNINTLRDYISLDDVGNFLVKEILASKPQASEKPVFLVSGKPSSIKEVKGHIEHIIGRKLFLSYSLDQTNYLDNTFSDKCLPENFQTVELSVGIRRIYNRFFMYNFGRNQ